MCKLHFFQNGCKGTIYFPSVKTISMNDPILSFFIGGLRSALPLATEGTQEQASVLQVLGSWLTVIVVVIVYWLTVIVYVGSLGIFFKEIKIQNALKAQRNPLYVKINSLQIFLSKPLAVLKYSSIFAPPLICSYIS